MSKRRIINICSILLSCLVFFICSSFMSPAMETNIITTSILLIVSVLQLSSEFFLHKKNDDIFELKFNIAIFVFMMIISAFSFFMYYIFRTSHISDFSDFYLLFGVILPVLGVKSADQYILFEKNSIIVNIDLQKKLKKSEISAVKTENNDLIFTYKHKDILFRMGRSRKLILDNIDKIRDRSIL